MKPAKVALLAALGMSLTSVSVYSLTPAGGFSRGAGVETVPTPEGTEQHDVPLIQNDLAHFVDGKTLTIEGRMGHAHLARSGDGETFVMLEVKAAEGVAPRGSAPVNLSLVIDRSGSMKGTRIRNAISAAQSAVDRLSDGDVVSVVTFDTQTQVVVPATVIGPGARERVNAAIRGITLGGDTCISCGIEEGMSLLAQTRDKVNRIILLSDGDANHGVRDVPGFRSIAQRALEHEVSVTTIGVDVDYNEKIMTAIAQGSNGRHYFVADPSGLERVFEEEAQSLTRTVASDAEVAIDLAPGVELERVFDRTFRRSGNQILVPLGTFAGPDVKTVLLKVRVPRGHEGATPVASAELSYRDLVAGNDGRCGGKLGVEVVDGAGDTDLDPVVSGRVQRSETAAALKDANGLFEQGKTEEARRRLAEREASLQKAADKARSEAAPAHAAAVARDFAGQLDAVAAAKPVFAAPPSAAPQETRAGKSAVRQNEKRAMDMGF